MTRHLTVLTPPQPAPVQHLPLEPEEYTIHEYRGVWMVVEKPSATFAYLGPGPVSLEKLHLCTLP